MSEPLDALALYDALPPDERAAVDRALRDDPALAEAFRGWQRLRAAVGRELDAALPDHGLLVLYALSDAPLPGEPAPAENLLDAADRARLGAAEGQLRTALAAHPGLVDAVRRLRADRDAFDRIWEAHTTVRNGRTSPAPQPASDRPPVARTAAPARPRRRAAPVWRYAAVVAVVLFGAVLAYVARRDAGFDTLRAAEAMAVELPDGSAVELAPGAVLQVAEEADVREARLLAGNALFAIRHDPADPFTVETPNAVVTVLGTTFGVAVDEAATEVVLVQGAVALASKGEAEAAVELAPGQRSRVVALDAPAAPAPADLDAALGWTGDLFVRAEPLSAVAARLAEAFGVPVEVDAALAREMVSATRFEREAGIEAALHELALTLGARVEALPGGGYRIARS
ncbi:MAG TPA: FecR domain-containing protein [Rubricoccaceae bacterium]|nr:FecR domain-containing protein [Rubricoccaceae bacterium]